MGISGNLTISGILQSPLTSLLSVSSSIIDGKIGNIISVSMPQFLTRNETLLPSTFTTGYLNTFQGTDNYIFKGGSSNNSYLQFQNNTYGNNKCYSGLINGNLRLYSPVNMDFYTIDGTLNATINSNTMTINNHLTVSGTIQSPITNLLSISHNNLSNYTYSLNNSALGVSINNETTRTNNLTTSSANTNSQLYSFNSTLTTADTNLGTSISNVNSKASSIIGVSLPQSLTRNETLLPSTFINSNLNKLGTSAVIGKTSMKQNFDFQVGSDNTTLSNPENTMAVISGGGENTKAILYLGTPNNQTSDSSSEAMKCALMAQGLSNYSRSKFHICMNNQIGNDSSLNAKLEDSVFSINMDGALTISGTALLQNNLTVSGILQSPLTNLISVSSGILDGKVGILGISHNNLSSYTYSLNNSTLGISINNNSIAIQDNTDLINSINISLLSEINNIDNYYDTQVNNLGTSISNTDGRVGTILSVSMPQFLTKNESVLPSTFTSSSLTSLGTLSRLGLNKTNTSGNINLMIKGLASGAGSVLLCPNVDNTEASIFFHPSSSGTGYDSGANGSWVVGNNIAGNDSNTFSFWNPNLQLKQLRMKIGGDTEIYKTGIINSQAENADSYLYLSNSNGADSALKTMIMSEAQSSWSRGKLHFCLNNDATTNSTSQNATIAHSRMSLDYSGNLSVSGGDIKQISGSNSVWMSVFSNDGHINATNNLRLYSNSGNFNAKFTSSACEFYEPTLITAGTDPFTLYNSGGSVNLKLQSSAGTMRFETNTTPDLTLYNNSNQDVAVFGTNRVCYFKDDIEVAGDSTTSGICYASAHIPSSSIKYKKNIKKIENNNLINKLEFKSYDKILDEENDITFKDFGLIIENDSISRSRNESS